MNENKNHQSVATASTKPTRYEYFNKIEMISNHFLCPSKEQIMNEKMKINVGVSNVSGDVITVIKQFPDSAHHGNFVII